MQKSPDELRDILYGNVSPSGKLSVSYPKVPLNEAVCYNYSTEEDSRIAWPFGYGLSYTTFEYSNLVVDKAVATDAKELHVSFEVTNTGSVEGDEIAQIYLSPVNDRFRAYRPIQLQGFGRVSLKPGEKKKLSFVMSTDQFGYYANNQWNIAPGAFIIKIGASSRDIRLSQEMELTGDNRTMPLRSEYFSRMK